MVARGSTDAIAAENDEEVSFSQTELTSPCSRGTLDITEDCIAAGDSLTDHAALMVHQGESLLDPWAPTVRIARARKGALGC